MPLITKIVIVIEIIAIVAFVVLIIDKIRIRRKEPKKYNKIKE